MRGPHYRSFTADGTKTRFRLPGSLGVITRLAVAEAAIDALSFAALERVRADTLYAATGGGMGTGTIEAVNGLLAELAPRANPLMVIATDADKAGCRYAAQLAEMAASVGMPVERALPPDSLNDWNDVLKERARKGGRSLGTMSRRSPATCPRRQG